MPPVSSELAALTADLHARIGRVLEAAAAEGRAHALGEIRALVGGSIPAALVKRGPGRPPKAASAMEAAGPKRRRKNSWSGLTAEQRLARVNAIRKGKGLPPRSE